MPINVVVPELGESVVKATVLRWHKQEGDAVAAGDLLVELETEKVNLDVSAPSAGILSRITRKAGEDVKIGDVLGAIEPGASETAPPKTEPPAAKESNGKHVDNQAPAKPARSLETPQVSTDSESPAGVKSEIRATPLAQRIAQESGVDLSRVSEGASERRVTKQDVTDYLQKQQASAAEKPGGTATAPPSSAPQDRREERVRMSRRRQTIARRLVEAQQTAAILTTFNQVDMTAVMEIRKQHKESFKQRYGVGLGLTSFFVKAAIGALQEFPLLNAEIQGDEIVYNRYFDIGIAVGAAEGLVVPVLRDAGRMTFAEIEKKISEFGQKAQDGTLALNDLRGGTFTITNGGVFGSLLSTPILNPPQVGILGLHKIEDRPIARDGQVVIRPMMYVALSYDHRLVDGREAVQFLVRIKTLIEDPGAMLLQG
ncbi:MAG: 2-oxoglutarate dehydrogenase complex dihydrolipoyllysine-residue succinyltransferase [Anaerolineae bacterium]|nr:2-oxoglutarate dehydrogenase complex dihydrolipoyllysine-residue succinyltransferase [Anaerolineae bacterium]